MKRRVSDARELRQLTGLVAALLVCAWVCPTAKAQQSDDHGRHGRWVSDDYLVPTHVNENTPPMGYRVTNAPLYETEEPLSSYSGGGTSFGASYGGGGTSFAGGYFPARTAKRNATAGSAKPHDDTAEWLNGAGGSKFGSMAVSESERNRLKALQAQAARQKADAIARERAAIMSRSTVDSGGLIRGIGQLK